MDIITLNQHSQNKWQCECLEYLRYEFKDVKPGELCLDIGSYQREWGKKMEEKFGVKVEYFDPLDNRAAWTFNGKMLFGGQYLYTNIFDEGEKTWYNCVDIAEFLQQEVAVMKINIEGGEYELLNYIIMMDLIKNVRHLQVQFHQVATIDYKSLYDIIERELSKTHEIEWRYPFCWESWKRK